MEELLSRDARSSGSRGRSLRLFGQLPGAAFKSLADLVPAVEDYIEHYNTAPSPFIWTAKATDILAKVKRARAAVPKK